ncbi:TetR/AcrR family transcriptional regulator [Streptomyces genisteinicus]|uniref:TetR/AcrR family transcriptional regulator n=1 Tax=Streptomyces genisteinicus TaxID=2768068 RepID=A0A7H0HTI4_9ACTN|nr:TetR/AcrR family transcriptional regulator [Streptomyces genisteinicus]QNP63850.1 TetR/AcrR family transcriptional regulator [Streptomyces genisteinicus]
MTTTETSGSGDVSRSLELLWGTGERPSRGPKPALSLDRIVTSAIRVADAEGLPAVSMRRLSTELGTGTMSLYRYVPGKAELLDLMLDRVIGEPLEGEIAPTPPEAWPDAVRGMAAAHLALYRAHPWLLKVNQSRTVLGPSAVRGLDASLFALRGMGLSDPETISVVIAVQSFTSGIARMELESAEAAQQTGQSEEEFWRRQEPYLSKAMLSGEYPSLAELSEDAFSSEFDHFAFGVERLIGGFRALVAERAGTA